jgi:hypothetical protein
MTRPAVDCDHDDSDNAKTLRVASRKREAALLETLPSVAVPRVRDGIKLLRWFSWSDSHTTIRETVSSKFIF